MNFEILSLLWNTIKSKIVHFQGDLQHLIIAGNPEAAFDLCTDFVPDCDNSNGNNDGHQVSSNQLDHLINTKIIQNGSFPTRQGQSFKPEVKKQLPLFSFFCQIKRKKKMEKTAIYNLKVVYLLKFFFLKDKAY